MGSPHRVALLACPAVLQQSRFHPFFALNTGEAQRNCAFKIESIVSKTLGQCECFRVCKVTAGQASSGTREHRALAIASGFMESIQRLE